MSENEEQHPWNALQQTPLDDLKRRAKIVDPLEDLETVSSRGLSDTLTIAAMATVWPGTSPTMAKSC